MSFSPVIPTTKNNFTQHGPNNCRPTTLPGAQRNCDLFPHGQEPNVLTMDLMMLVFNMAPSSWLPRGISINFYLSHDFII